MTKTVTKFTTPATAPAKGLGRRANDLVTVAGLPGTWFVYADDNQGYCWVQPFQQADARPTPVRTCRVTVVG